MKTRIFQIILVIVMLLTICSCAQQGEPGLNGANGKSAYEIAVQNGFKGTVTEWLESLKGEQGPQGEKGESGVSQEKVDTSLTYLTFSFPADKLSLDLRGIYRNAENAGGLTYIDWGDGTGAVVESNEDVLKHTYSEAGEYTVTLTGITTFGRAALRAQSTLTSVIFGDIVTSLGEFAFDECGSLSELRCMGVYPPEIAVNTFDTQDTSTTKRIEKVTVPTKSMLIYTQGWGLLSYAIVPEDAINVSYTDVKVTVGENGDYKTLNGAITYLSTLYPIYKSGGVKCEIEIIGGTVINEQIFVEKIDLSYITISTSASNNTVKVDVTGWGGVTHDTRGNRPFFSAENGGRLPAINCLFSCITPEGGWNDNNAAVGYFCNRGSSGVVLGSTATKEVGFEGFYDNIIANNNSEIVLREAVARNAARYGVMSRHISRVSARSADITGCGDAAAYADRVSSMDVRHADLSGSFRAIVAYNASTVTANETVANNLTGFWAIDSREGSVVNCRDIKIDGANSVFNIEDGGTIIAVGAVLENIAKAVYSKAPNELTSAGVIYN